MKKQLCLLLSILFSLEIVTACKSPFSELVKSQEVSAPERDKGLAQNNLVALLIVKTRSQSIQSNKYYKPQHDLI